MKLNIHYVSKSSSTLCINDKKKTNASTRDIQKKTEGSVNAERNKNQNFRIYQGLKYNKNSYDVTEPKCSLKKLSSIGSDKLNVGNLFNIHKSNFKSFNNLSNNFRSINVSPGKDFSLSPSSMSLDESLMEHRTKYLVKVTKILEEIESFLKEKKNNESLLKIFNEFKRIKNKEINIIFDFNKFGTLFNENETKLIMTNFYTDMKLSFDVMKELQAINEPQKNDFPLKLYFKNHSISRNKNNEQEKEVQSLDKIRQAVLKDKIKELKNGSRIKENFYKLKIINLEKESEDLVLLLNKNKEYYDKYQEGLSHIRENENTISELNFKYAKMVKEKEKENKILMEELADRNYQNEQKEKIISALENKIADLLDKIKAHEKDQKMFENKILQQKENILMNKEDIEGVLLQLVQEKKAHENTKYDLIACQSVIENAKKNGKL